LALFGRRLPERAECLVIAGVPKTNTNPEWLAPSITSPLYSEQPT
jgi:hypothetical protein